MRIKRIILSLKGMPGDKQSSGNRFRMKDKKKVLVIGLDCAAPQLVFERWKDELPNIKRLMERGVFGKLRSIVPPITCPAWMCMMTGKDPGQLGIYGFRNRGDYSYNNLRFPTSKSVKEDTVWDILSRNGKKVILLGIPLTYPPKPVNGLVISSFLTPSTDSEYTYPGDLKGEIEALVGDYIIDVENFRTQDKENLLVQIYDMTHKRFRVAKYLLEEKEWDFFAMVEMGVDRIHHGFWKFIDPEHRKYQIGNPFENSIKDY